MRVQEFSCLVSFVSNIIKNLLLIDVYTMYPAESFPCDFLSSCDWIWVIITYSSRIDRGEQKKLGSIISLMCCVHFIRIIENWCCDLIWLIFFRAISRHDVKRVCYLICLVAWNRAFSGRIFAGEGGLYKMLWKFNATFSSELHL